LEIDLPFKNIDSTYPHLKILTQAMVGKPAWNCGKPLVNVFANQSSWLDAVPMVELLRIPEVFKFFKGVGIKKEYFFEHEQRSVKRSARVFTRLLCRRDGSQKSNKSSAFEFLKINATNPVIMINIMSALKDRVLEKVIKTMRSL
jgi:hypothetical protein